MFDKVAVQCRPLTEESLDSLLAFMDRDAFADNPHWRSCHCVFHYLSDETDGAWSERTGADNRAELTARVRTGTGQWIVAYREGQIVGWVNADWRPALRRYDEWETPSEPDTGLVACFVVHPAWRRRGIARQLLDAAVSTLFEQGARRVDAYVIADPAAAARTEPELGPDQFAHHGPLSMYRDAGFVLLEQDGGIAHVRKTEAR